MICSFTVSLKRQPQNAKTANGLAYAAHIIFNAGLAPSTFLKKNAISPRKKTMPSMTVQ